MKTNQNDTNIDYIELPLHSGKTVKIDLVLEARMKAFLKARRIRRFTFTGK